jgi:gallate decarboxylase subunit D
MQGRTAKPLITAAAGNGRHRVDAAVQFLGDDVLLSIWGGAMAHIGSVCITQPRPSLRDPDATSYTTSVHNFIGHKDEAVARCCAERIATAFDRKTVAVAGIHIENAKAEDIAAIMKNVDRLCAQLIKKLKAKR